MTSTCRWSPVRNVSAGVAIEIEGRRFVAGLVISAVPDPSRPEPDADLSATMGVAPEPAAGVTVAVFETPPADGSMPSACSTVTKVVEVVTRSKRSFIPVGGVQLPFTLPMKDATNISSGCVVVIVGVVSFAPLDPAPAWTSTDVTVSTFQEALMPPATYTAAEKFQV